MQNPAFLDTYLVGHVDFFIAIDLFRGGSHHAEMLLTDQDP